MIRKEFGIVNLVVEKFENEVKIWACNRITGENVFRLKAMGKVHAATIADIVIEQKFRMHELFTEVERILSHAISVQFVQGYAQRGVREVIQARDNLRNLMRKAGYKGNF